MDLFREAILSNTTMSSISYCKAVTGRGQTAVNGKGHDEGQESKYSTALKTHFVQRSVITISERHMNFVFTDSFLSKPCAGNASSTIIAASSNIWSTPQQLIPEKIFDDG